LQNIQQQLVDTKQQLSKTESQLSYFIEKQRESVSVSSSSSPEDLLQQQLQQELSSIKLELQNYKEQLNHEKENTAQYKAIAIANEQALKEMSDLSDTYKQSFQQKLDEANSQTEKYQITIKELQDTLESTREIFNSERDLMNSKVDSLTVQLKETKAEKESLQQNMSQVEEREQLLKRNLFKNNFFY
jgi:chromosome segregation ATPase